MRHIRILLITFSILHSPFSIQAALTNQTIAVSTDTNGNLLNDWATNQVRQKLGLSNVVTAIEATAPLTVTASNPVTPILAIPAATTNANGHMTSNHVQLLSTALQPYQGDARYVMEETDPVFSQHPAAGINNTLIDWISEMHEYWGDHRVAGYLTNEPSWEASPFYGLDVTNLLNWDFGWEHALIQGNPHNTGITNISGLTDALDAKMPYLAGTNPGDNWVWNGTNWGPGTPLAGGTGAVITVSHPLTLTGPETNQVLGIPAAGTNVDGYMNSNQVQAIATLQAQGDHRTNGYAIASGVSNLTARFISQSNIVAGSIIDTGNALTLAASNATASLYRSGVDSLMSVYDRFGNNYLLALTTSNNAYLQTLTNLHLVAYYGSIFTHNPDGSYHLAGVNTAGVYSIAAYSQAGAGILDLRSNDSWTVQARINAGGDSYLLGRMAIGETTPQSQLTLFSGTLGTNSGDFQNLYDAWNYSGNADQLFLQSLRTSAGSSWVTASKRLLHRVDSTDMSWIQWNPPGSYGGLAFGNDIYELARLTPSGNWGILTNDPAYPLDVAGTIRAHGFVLQSGGYRVWDTNMLQFGATSTNMARGNHTHSGVYEPTITTGPATNVIFADKSNGPQQWTNVAGKPTTFPPSAHSQTWGTITDTDWLTNSLASISNANAWATNSILAASNSAYAAMIVAIASSNANYWATNAILAASNSSYWATNAILASSNQAILATLAALAASNSTYWLTNQLANKAPLGLDTNVYGLQFGGGSLTNVSTTNLPIGTITGLQTALDGKLSTTHAGVLVTDGVTGHLTYNEYLWLHNSIVDNTAAIATKAATNHTHNTTTVKSTYGINEGAPVEVRKADGGTVWIYPAVGLLWDNVTVYTP